MIQTNTQNTEGMDYLNMQLNSLFGFFFAGGAGWIGWKEIATAALMGFIGAFFAAFGTWAFKKITTKTDK